VLGDHGQPGALAPPLVDVAAQQAQTASRQVA
jgi:hypothetical protein